MLDSANEILAFGKPTLASLIRKRYENIVGWLANLEMGSKVSVQPLHLALPVYANVADHSQKDAATYQP